MALYNENVKTHILDPRIHLSMNRSEWRFDSDRVYLPSLRLSNLRFNAAHGTPNRELGNLALIKNIYLMDGPTVS